MKSTWDCPVSRTARWSSFDRRRRLQRRMDGPPLLNNGDTFRVTGILNDWKLYIDGKEIAKT
jgi:hypothetical protein